MNLVLEFERQHKLSYQENTIINYKINMREFLEFAKNYYSLDYVKDDCEVMKKITWDCCMDFRNHLHDNGMKKTTINRKLSAMRVLFDFAMDKGIVEHNPTTKIKNLSTSDIMPHSEYLTENELSQLLHEIGKKHSGTKNFDFVSARDRLLYLLIATSGLRIEEALNLREKDFNFDENEILVLGKGGKFRYVYIDNLVKEWYNKYMVEKTLLMIKNRMSINNDNEDYIFLSANGKKLSARASNLNLEKYCKRANIKVISNHALRHTFATIQMERGTHHLVISEMLGHSSITTTKRYVHTRKEIAKQNIGVRL